jgi:hypothetical protein
LLLLHLKTHTHVLYRISIPRFPDESFRAMTSGYVSKSSVANYWSASAVIYGHGLPEYTKSTDIRMLCSLEINGLAMHVHFSFSRCAAFSMEIAFPAPCPCAFSSAAAKLRPNCFSTESSTLTCVYFTLPTRQVISESRLSEQRRASTFVCVYIHTRQTADRKRLAK